MLNDLSRRSFGVGLAGAALYAAGAARAQGDPVAEFYKGKTVSILVGYEGGGGYDLYARLVAQYLGRHIPGDRNITGQDIARAGRLPAARTLTTTSAESGT